MIILSSAMALMLAAAPVSPPPAMSALDDPTPEQAVAMVKAANAARGIASAPTAIPANIPPRPTSLFTAAPKDLPQPPAKAPNPAATPTG